MTTNIESPLQALALLGKEATEDDRAAARKFLNDIIDGEKVPATDYPFSEAEIEGLRILDEQIWLAWQDQAGEGDEQHHRQKRIAAMDHMFINMLTVMVPLRRIPGIPGIRRSAQKCQATKKHRAQCKSH